MAFKKKQTLENGESDVQTLDYPLKNFLEKRIVKLAPISEDVIPGVPYEKLPDGFIYEGMQRSLERARDTASGYFKPMFDDSKKYYTPQYPEEPMTELEFFMRISGLPLNEETFWTGTNRKDSQATKKIPYTVFLNSKGMTFDLSNVKEHIDYKLVKTHTGKYIAPSWEERYYRPTYWFAMVDEKVSTDRKKEEIELKLAATTEFNKIKDSRELLAEFLIIYNGEAAPSSSSSTDWLFNEVYKLMDKNPKQFLSVVNDPSRDEKILIFKALKAGALKKTNKKYMTLGEIPLGSLSETVMYFKDPENYEFVEKVRHQVESYNKDII